MPNKQADAFIAKIYPAAIAAGKETGMSWQLMLAQAAQETGWGKHVLEGTNNLFNIKADRSWQGQSKTFQVWEIEGGKKVWQDDPFRVYADYTEAFKDRARFLQENPRYADLFKDGIKGVFTEEAKALQKAGYATDPHYADNLVKVFNGPTMQHALKKVQQTDASAETLELNQKISATLPQLTPDQHTQLTAYCSMKCQQQDLPLGQVAAVTQTEFNGKHLLVMHHQDQSQRVTADVHKALSTPTEQSLAALQPQQVQEQTPAPRPVVLH